MALPAAFPNVTNLTGYMQDESVVNGVWNHILSQCFPFDEFIIAPEYRIPNFRVDLAVIRRVDQRIVFVYEGKREGYTNWQYDQHIAQLAGYLAVMASQGKRGIPPGILSSTDRERH